MIDGTLSTSEELQLILFEIGNSFYGIPIEKVSEINRLEQITVLPKAPKFIEGVINLRGNVVPVIDLRMRFGMKQIEKTKKNKIIIVLLEKRLFGIIVDAVQEVVVIAKDQIEPTLPTTTGLKAEFINAIGKYQDKLIIILDIENIILSKDEIILEEKI